MIKDRQPDWQDTNVNLIGSDIDRKCKEAAANGEPQWTGCGEKAGLQVWRIEQFRVVPWPKSKYGRFHIGDSYIVLNTYVKDPANPNKLSYDAHFWIGSESTQDEYGTAAYKTVELDDYLKGDAVQHREVENHESAKFLEYFKGGAIQYLKGGVATGFKKVEAEVRPTRLLRVKGRAGNIAVTEVACKRDAMNSGDVFILDCEGGGAPRHFGALRRNSAQFVDENSLTRHPHLSAVFQWNGKESNPFEISKASEFAMSIQQERKITVLTEGGDEGDPKSKDDPFWGHLPGERRMLGIKVGDIKVQSAEKGGKDDDVKAFEPVLYRLSDRLVGSGLSCSKIGEGKSIPVSTLFSCGDDIALYDNGFEVWVWVGKGASASERVSAFPYAQKYLKDKSRPASLPITREAEGKEERSFLEMFGPAEKADGCACCVVS